MIDKLKAIKDLLSEGRKFLTNGNVPQGCEKFYKVTENCIKLLAEYFELEEYKKAIEEGGWWSKLLGKASVSLAKKLNEEKFVLVWEKAFDIHRHGFHEEEYTKENIEDKKVTQLIEWLLSYTEKILTKEK